MLQLKNINKKYVTGGFEQIALDDVSLNLRDNEFVATQRFGKDHTPQYHRRTGPL